MTLKAYLDAGHSTAAEIARRTGLSAASITRIRDGSQKPSYDAIEAIVKATGGAVTANDFFQRAA